jgi:preprotein translocase subunit YajC
LGFLIPLIVLFAIMYLFLIRPQQRRRQAQLDLLKQLDPGDEIITVGGVYGTVREVRDDELTIEIAPGTNVRLDRRAVAALVPEEAEAHEPAELEPGDEPQARES